MEAPSRNGGFKILSVAATGIGDGSECQQNPTAHSSETGQACPGPIDSRTYAARWLVLQHGWFTCNTDAGDCARIFGCCFHDFQQAKQYLSSDANLSADDYALVIPCQPDYEHPRGRLIRAPVKDQSGQSAIIAAMFVQIGEKDVKFGQDSALVVKTEDLTNVQVSAFRAYFDDEAWNELIQAPARCALQV